MTNDFNVVLYNVKRFSAQRQRELASEAGALAEDLVRNLLSLRPTPQVLYLNTAWFAFAAGAGAGGNDNRRAAHHRARGANSAGATALEHVASGVTALEHDGYAGTETQFGSWAAQAPVLRHYGVPGLNVPYALRHANASSGSPLSRDCYLSDSLHPSALGHELIAQAVLEYVQRARDATRDLPPWMDPSQHSRVESTTTTVDFTDASAADDGGLGLARQGVRTVLGWSLSAQQKLADGGYALLSLPLPPGDVHLPLRPDSKVGFVARSARASFELHVHAGRQGQLRVGHLRSWDTALGDVSVSVRRDHGIGHGHARSRCATTIHEHERLAPSARLLLNQSMNQSEAAPAPQPAPPLCANSSAAAEGQQGPWARVGVLNGTWAHPISVYTRTRLTLPVAVRNRNVTLRFELLPAGRDAEIVDGREAERPRFTVYTVSSL